MSIARTFRYRGGQVLEPEHLNDHVSQPIEDRAGRNGLVELEDSVIIQDGSGDRYIVIPKGTTAQRPASPVEGMVRYNTALGALEFWHGERPTGVLLRATLTRGAGQELWPIGGTVAAGADLEIAPGLILTRVQWRPDGPSAHLVLNGSGGPGMVGAFTGNGVAVGKSVYVVVGTAFAETPYAVFGMAAGGFANWDTPDTAQWAHVRAVLNGITEGDQYELVIGNPGSERPRAGAWISPLTTTTDVTFGSLLANGDIGLGAGQIAAGDHSHA